MVLITEPLFNPGSWIFSKKNNAAIWATGLNGVKDYEDERKREDDFVAIRIGNSTFTCSYLSPNTTMETFSSKIDKISAL